MAAALLVLLALLALWLWTPDKDRAALEAKYLNAPDDMRASVRIAGLRLHVRDSGPKTAPAVILIHGVGSTPAHLERLGQRPGQPAPRPPLCQPRAVDR